MALSLELQEELKSGKKAPLLTKKDVEAKFASKGVTPFMIREATGPEKIDVVKLRSLLVLFEEAHDRNFDVAKGPWALAVEFYKVFFFEALPEVEAQSREWLILDVLKKCWAVVGQRHTALMTPGDLPSARDNQAVNADLVVPNTDGLVGKVPEVSLPDADGAIQLKSALSAGEDEEAILEAAVLERAKQRTFELSEMDADIAKQEVTRASALTELKRAQSVRERRERERV